MTEQRKTLRVTQIKSTIGFSEKQGRIIRSLGLGKIGRSRDHYDTAEIRGMIFKVKHLVKVEEI